MAAATVDMIVFDHRIDCTVELDASHLRATERPIQMDVVDLVVLDQHGLLARRAPWLVAASAAAALILWLALPASMAGLPDRRR